MPRRSVVRVMLARTSWTRAPASERLPADTLRMMTAGRNLLLGEVVGGCDSGIIQEDEHLVLVLAEVLAEPLVVRVALLRLEEVGELLLRVADRSLPEALAPHLDRELACPTELEGLLQEVLHLLGEQGGLTVLSLQHLGAPAEQVRVALGEGAAEGRVHGPAVDDQGAAEGLSEDRARHVTATAQPDGVDGDALRGGEHPQPRLLRRAGDVPPRLIPVHDRAPAQVLDERLVRRLAAFRDARTGTRQRPPADREAEAQHQDLDDLAIGHADPLLEVDAHRQHLGPEHHRGRALRRRGLVRVPAVHPPAAALAAAVVVDVLRRVRPHGRDVDHVLVVGPMLVHFTPTERARPQRNVDLGVHMLGDRPMRGRVPGLSARLLRVALALASTERCCLPLPGALRLRQPPLQVLVLLDQPRVLFLQLRIVSPKPRALRPQQQVLRTKGPALLVHVGGSDAAGPWRVAGTPPGSGYALPLPRVPSNPGELSR